MPREVFVAGQVLTAAELNVVSDQTVMTFAGTAARGSAIPSPTEGMTSYLDDLNRIEVYNGSAWGAVGTILQVVSATKTDTFSTTSTSFTTVTGLSVTITPAATSSKILVMASVALGASATSDQTAFLRFSGGNTGSYLGDTAGSRTRTVVAKYRNTSNMNDIVGIDGMAMLYLDSPSTTSATTYTVQLRGNGGAVYVNRGQTDQDNDANPRGASTITVMEVAG